MCFWELWLRAAGSSTAALLPFPSCLSLNRAIAATCAIFLFLRSPAYELAHRVFLSSCLCIQAGWSCLGLEYSRRAQEPFLHQCLGLQMMYDLLRPVSHHLLPPPPAPKAHLSCLSVFTFTSRSDRRGSVILGPSPTHQAVHGNARDPIPWQNHS